jgi:hypothetical protein
MKNTSLKLSAIFGFISVITTLGVHLISFPANSFEESVLLYKNTGYLFSQWWIIFHCITVFISMGGVYIAINNKNTIYPYLGLFSFGVFSWTEITRMFLSLTYLSHLRQSYHTQTNELLKTILKSDILNFQYFGSGLFSVFILAFALGNLFFGLELIKSKGLGRLVGIALILWFSTSILALANDFYNISGVSDFFGIYNVTGQPLIRGLIAFWLMKEANGKPSL